MRRRWPLARNHTNSQFSGCKLMLTLSAPVWMGGFEGRGLLQLQGAGLGGWQGPST